MNHDRDRTQGIFEKRSDRNGMNIGPPPVKRRQGWDADQLRQQHPSDDVPRPDQPE
jgi:hypothetical protein